MLRETQPLALALLVALTAGPSFAACTEHTFDPCPEPQSGYSLDVDQKTGRTWLKEAKTTATDTSTLGRLSASARKVPAGALAKAQANSRAGEWQTRIKRYRKGAR